MVHTVLPSLIQQNDQKIVLIVMDGLGDLLDESTKKTPLMAAQTPNCDILAQQGICGLHEPIGPGLTPGSGPAHLGLFGYDPLTYNVGRGVLSALGIEFDLQKGDIAARGNFCTINKNGIVIDRRAGRISTDRNNELCQMLRSIKLENTDLYIETVKEYRFLFVMRGNDLSSDISDTDPQQTGRPTLEPVPKTEKAQRTARLVASFIEQAQKILLDQEPANMILLRGFASPPSWPLLNKEFGLTAAAVAAYPMYKGVAKLVGMKALDVKNDDMDSKLETIKSCWNDFDFIFVHVKKTDSAGEDGDFMRKVTAIEETDRLIGAITQLKPSVIVVTGDHSTPCIMKSHSWHPVPLLLWSKQCRPDKVARFDEISCLHGSIGPRFPAKYLMPLMLAHAQRIKKYGA